MKMQHGSIREAIDALKSRPVTEEGFARFTLPIPWTAASEAEAKSLGFVAANGGDENTMVFENVDWRLEVRCCEYRQLVGFKWLLVICLEASVAAKGALVALNGPDEAIGLCR